ncbi:MAG: hypothetical protein FJX60_20200 [Alphaproteobacteria bacterium]|nr:hypothetical protein [Alphaproteobacteria bacterium]
MSHQIMPLFPTLVSLVTYEQAADFNPRAKARIEEIERTGVGARNAEGQWQYGPKLHEDPAFHGFTEFILRTVGERFSALHYESSPMAITGVWANVNQPGYSHRIHAHSNNFISGVYYVTAPEKAGGIVFHDPRKQHQVLLPTVTKPTEMNSTMTRLPSVEGQAILFPSWLEHYTERNEADVPRISIAFNLMLVGNFGSPETFAAGYVAQP